MGSPANSSSLITSNHEIRCCCRSLHVRSFAAEAEPKADADALYGYYGYGHHLGYAHHGYYGYPYAHRGYFYGKRSADAEPEAKADADALYGYYGYAHHPYAYGHHYGYAHHGYYGYPYGYAYWG